MAANTNIAHGAGRGVPGGSGPRAGTIHPLFPGRPEPAGQEEMRGPPAGRPRRQGPADARAQQRSCRGGAGRPPESPSIHQGCGRVPAPGAWKPTSTSPGPAHGPSCAYPLGDWAGPWPGQLGTDPGQTAPTTEGTPVCGPAPTSAPHERLRPSWRGWGQGSDCAPPCSSRSPEAPRHCRRGFPPPYPSPAEGDTGPEGSSVRQIPPWSAVPCAHPALGHQEPPGATGGSVRP